MLTINSATLIPTITQFLGSIGIPVVFGTISESTFLPGILISEGGLIVDKEKLLYPGDLLHEAGHIAAMPPEERREMHGNVGNVTDKGKSDGEEMMAIAWSYAACVHLDIDPKVVFHPDGYRGASDWYIEQYTSGNAISLPLMQWVGFCYDVVNAAKNNAAPFPAMIRWLRE